MVKAVQSYVEIHRILKQADCWHKTHLPTIIRLSLAPKAARDPVLTFVSSAKDLHRIEAPWLASIPVMTEQELTAKMEADSLNLTTPLSSPGFNMERETDFWRNVHRTGLRRMIWGPLTAELWEKHSRVVADMLTFVINGIPETSKKKVIVVEDAAGADPRLLRTLELLQVDGALPDKTRTHLSLHIRDLAPEAVAATTKKIELRGFSEICACYEQNMFAPQPAIHFLRKKSVQAFIRCMGDYAPRERRLEAIRHHRQLLAPGGFYWFSIKAHDGSMEGVRRDTFKAQWAFLRRTHVSLLAGIKFFLFALDKVFSGAVGYGKRLAEGFEKGVYDSPTEEILADDARRNQLLLARIANKSAVDAALACIENKDFVRNQLGSSPSGEILETTLTDQQIQTLAKSAGLEEPAAIALSQLFHVERGLGGHFFFVKMVAPTKPTGKLRRPSKEKE